MEGVLISHGTGRETRRKKCVRKLLEETYRGGPVILDELRWAALGTEIDAGNYAGSKMSRSWLNSFARTIREQFPDYTIHKVPIKANTPLGIVARTAVFRLADLAELRQFLAAEDPCILCRYKTDLPCIEPRYRWRYVTPQHHAATFRFFDGLPAQLTYEEIDRIPGTFIPATQKISIVAPRVLRWNQSHSPKSPGSFSTTSPWMSGTLLNAPAASQTWSATGGGNLTRGLLLVTGQHLTKSTHETTLTG